MHYLFKGIKARDVLHNFIEKMIKEKLQKQWDGYNDAFDYILSSAKENNHDISLQDLKVCVCLRICYSVFLFC